MANSRQARRPPPARARRAIRGEVTAAHRRSALWSPGRVDSPVSLDSSPPLTMIRLFNGRRNMTCDLLQKIELIHAAGTQFIPPNARDIVRTFYDVLTILDNKGLALLAFDGIIVAATTFAAEKGGAFHRRGMARRLAVFIIVLALVASVACLLVSEISYPFFHYVACNAPHSLDYTEEINHLAELAGVPELASDRLGRSMVPVLRDPLASVQDSILSPMTTCSGCRPALPVPTYARCGGATGPTRSISASTAAASNTNSTILRPIRFS